MDKKHLYQLLCTKEAQVEKAKFRRTIITIAGFACAYFILFWIIERPVGLDILGNIGAAILLGGIHFFVNSVIFLQLFHMSEQENKLLESLRKQLSAMESNEVE